MSKHQISIVTAWFLGLFVPSLGFATDGFAPDQALVERGRYVALVSGCNDCHTAGYAVGDGDLKAFYHFVRSLGDSGAPAPAALAPGQQPSGPRAQWLLE